MAQPKAKAKECDRDLKPVPATTTVTFSYLDVTYELNLCEAHAGQLDREMAGWTRVAREVEEDARTFSDAETERWRELLDREDKNRATHGGEVTRGVRLLHHGEDDDDEWVGEPAVFDEWGLTTHAKERQLERGFTHKEVMEAVVAPERVFLNWREGCRTHVRGRVAVVVHHEHRAVITVMFRNREDFLNHKKNKEHVHASA